MSEHALADSILFDFDRQARVGPYRVTATRLSGVEDGVAYIVRVQASGDVLLIQNTWTEIVGNDDADYNRVFEQLCARARLLVPADEGGSN